MDRIVTARFAQVGQGSEWSGRVRYGLAWLRDSSESGMVRLATVRPAEMRMGKVRSGEVRAERPVW